MVRLFIAGLVASCALTNSAKADGDKPVEDKNPQCSVISAMDAAEDWEGPFPPKLATEPGGRKCLRFDFGKGGQGEWTLKTFPKSGIDMRAYDAIKFDYRVEGGSFALSTNIRQWPWMGGFLCLYSQIDASSCQPSAWTTDIALSAENAWAPTYNRDEPCFQLNLYDCNATPGKEVSVFIDNIRVVRYPFTVDCVNDLFLGQGERTDGKDGSVTYRYPLTLRNRLDKELEVKLDLDASRLRSFTSKVDIPLIRLPANGAATCTVTLTLPKRGDLPPAYCELAVARFSLPDQPETEYAVNLLPAVPLPIKHPSLFATAKQFEEAKQRGKKWGWAKQAVEEYVKRAELAMALPDTLPEYQPRAEMPEDKVCGKCADKTKLRIIDDPKSVHRYQCETCGQMLSPKADFTYATVDGYWWKPGAKEPPGHAIVFNKWGNILDLAIAWRLTGEEKYLLKVSKILREYLRVLPAYPFCFAAIKNIAYETFDCKGSFKVGHFFSQCGWLNRMACVLDLVWDSGAITPAERDKLMEELKGIVWTRLRLCSQHRANELALSYSILSDDASLLAYVHDNPINGGAVLSLKDTVLPDGMTNMAGQYLAPVMSNWLGLIQIYNNVGLPVDKEVPGLRKFASAMQLWQDPDGVSPSLGDAAPMRFAGQLWYFELCYGWYGNPEDIVPVQRALFQRWENDKWKTPWESLSRQGYASAEALFYCAENIPRKAPPAARPSHNFPDGGLLVFNQGEADKQLWVAMPFGKLLGHGFHDNLHLEWWALGQKISVKHGHRGRHHPVHENTLLVDGKDQMKTPCEVSEFVGAGPVQGAVVSSKDMYPGSTISRTVMLYDGLIFLYDKFSSETGHDYDMVYANAGTIHCDLPFQPRGPLSSEKDVNNLPVNYALFDDVGTTAPPQPVQVSWDNLKTPGIGVRMTQFSIGEPSELLRVKAPLVKIDWAAMTGDTNAAGYTDEPDSRIWMGKKDDTTSCLATKLIRRMHGKQAGLLTILEPFRGGKPRLEGIERLPFTLDGKPSDQGMALRYRADGMTHQVLLCPVPGVKELNGVKTNTMFTAGPNGFLR